MNKSALKKYAPQARLDFIAAVTRRAELLGLNPESPANVEKQGDALLINGQAFPAAYGGMRTTLEARIRDQGFMQVMEAMAYTWFNRLVAVRYMELHGFLDHGYRVLSHPANKETGHTQPEILDHIADLDLPGLDKSVALELKLAGNKDEALYREVLLAQCHALHQAMPFLFESLDDATELLLPDGLLRTDSILGKLVTAIDDADWQEVEIIGWLYQFYISEKKDQVIGKVVKSEDIPAATQLFTPNWIVKYLVQNSLGRLWLMANPTSTLATKWEYYIQPAEQTPEVNAQLDALIQARITEDGATLNPESLTLLDPACGSGHILVEAYDLLRDIYLERGYRRQDIPRLILEKNLYGLDIDDRAAQLAGFALLMKARGDDRRLFGRAVVLNVLALQEAKVGSAEELHSALNAPQIDYATVSQLVATFEKARTFGSLIQPPNELIPALPDLRRELEVAFRERDLFGRDAAAILLKLTTQAELLAARYNAVVVNPPYMGRKGMNNLAKDFLSAEFPRAQNDFYAAFMLRSRNFLERFGLSAFITRQDWMFTARNLPFREEFLNSCAIQCLLHVGPNTFPELSGDIVQGAGPVFWGNAIPGIDATFLDATAEETDVKQRSFVSGECRFTKSQDAFRSLPGTPLAYWAPGATLEAFSGDSIKSVSISDGQNKTADNDRFVRCFWEVDAKKIGVDSKWLPYAKGGGFRKWSGNITEVIDWSLEARSHYRKSSRCRIVPEYLWYRKGITWSRVASAGASNGFRVLPAGSTFDMVGSSIFFKDDDDILTVLGLLNTSAASFVLQMLNPTVDLQVSDVRNLPLMMPPDRAEFDSRVAKLIDISKADWDAYEFSMDFLTNALVSLAKGNDCKIEEMFGAIQAQMRSSVEATKAIEEHNNRIMIDAYGLDERIGAIVPIEQITLLANPAFRFGTKITARELVSRAQQAAAQELVSYIAGCMMGRYSLDAPGLIYAHAGNEGFDPSRYTTFPADDDGIVPITDEAWFDDDGANRIREFVRVVWGKDTEAENMAWLAESLGSKASESADDTIRRYLSRDFYKDHLQTYKKRPIYWLFSSGKHKAFEALVYLHRYNAGTLSRMRMEYVVPLQSRMQARIDSLEQDIQASTSSAEQKRFQKQKDKLIKQLDELRRFDENLRHYADQRITLDLDDGVKANYGMFGDLLAEVKAVTGKKG